MCMRNGLSVTRWFLDSPVRTGINGSAVNVFPADTIMRYPGIDQKLSKVRIHFPISRFIYIYLFKAAAIIECPVADARYRVWNIYSFQCHAVFECLCSYTGYEIRDFNRFQRNTVLEHAFTDTLNTSRNGY